MFHEVTYFLVLFNDFVNFSNLFSCFEILVEEIISFLSIALGHNFGPGQGAFLNIELITEKTAAYWCKWVYSYPFLLH